MSDDTKEIVADLEENIEDQTELTVDELVNDHLTAMQWDLLVSVNQIGKPSGQDVKDELNPRYPNELTHGRLYPNLDKIVGFGLVEKGELDRRTNYYELTDKGRELLLKRRRWFRNGSEVFDDE